MATEAKHHAATGASLHLRLEPAESLGPGLRRMALEQLAITRAAFSPAPDDEALHAAVHAGRKAAKRTRALLRLVRDDLGTAVYRNENAVVRDQAKRLSDLRIANVLVATFADLAVAEASSLPAPLLEEVHHELVQRRARLAAAFRDDRDELAAAKVAIDCIRSRIKSWPGLTTADGTGANDLALAIPGITRSYRRGRQAVAKTRRSPTDRALHEWRKQANYFRFQLEALSTRLPRSVARLEVSLNELSELLGTDHDLADLADVVAGNPELISGAGERAALSAAIIQRRTPLQKRALRAGKRIYKRPPEDLIGRLAAHWSNE